MENWKHMMQFHQTKVLFIEFDCKSMLDEQHTQTYSAIPVYLISQNITRLLLNINLE